MREFGWRSWIAAGCVGLLVSCAEDPARAAEKTVVQEPSVEVAGIPHEDAARFVECMRLSEVAEVAQVAEGEVVLDHAVPVVGMVPATVLVIASSPDRRYVSIFEADPGVKVASPEGPIGYRTVLKTSLPCYGAFSNRPDAPQQADLGGGADKELLLGFQTVLADRVPYSALICARGEDGWMALTAPGLITTLRDQLDKTRDRVGIYQEDKMNSIEVAGKRICLQGLSMGGGWRIVPPKDGQPARLKGLGVLSDSGTGGAKHQAAIASYRFTGEGWALDADWNGGRAKIFEDVKQARAAYR